MKKSLICLLVLIILSLINCVNAEIRINEVELNPKGDDAGYEWIELYSEYEINLSG